MIDIENILSLGTRSEAQSAALELFRFQCRECEPYRQYIELIGIDPYGVESIEQIPFMPVEIFKSQKVYCGPQPEQVVFTSSTTGGGEASKHYMASEESYRRACRASFAKVWGDVSDWSFYGLLPSYLERNGSSLVYMVEDFISLGGGGLYLNNHEQMLNDMACDTKKKILIGVSYALLDLSERGDVRLENTVVMETGGMKGRRKELPKSELHKVLCEGLGVDSIASEYGMAELSSQAYSKAGGIFTPASWLMVMVRDARDPYDIRHSGTGGANIIDLTNIFSCAFIQTDDMVRVEADGSFEILGRIEGSDIRGCNLLIQ